MNNKIEQVPEEFKKLANDFSKNGFISMLIFLFILTIGFIYEWKKGALDWE